MSTAERDDEPKVPPAPAGPPGRPPYEPPVEPVIPVYEAMRFIWHKWARRLALGVLVVLFFASLWVMREILLPFILALVTAYVLSPAVRWLTRPVWRGLALPRWTAVVLIYLALFGGLTAASYTLVPRLAHEVTTLGEEVPLLVRQASQVWLPAAEQRLRGFLRDLDAPMSVQERGAVLGVRPAVSGPSSAEEIRVEPGPAPGPAPILPASASEDGDLDAETGPREERPLLNLDGMVVELESRGESLWRLRAVTEADLAAREAAAPPTGLGGLRHYVENLLDSSAEYYDDLLALGGRVVQGALHALMTALLTFMLAAFLLLDTPRVLGFFRSLVPPAYRGEYDDLLVGVNEGLSGVIRGQLLICLINGLLTFAGLAVLGVKYSLVLACLAAVCSLIPIFGTLLSSVPVVLLALTQSFALGLMALGWILLIHLIEANLLNPKIMGTAARIHPVLVVLALVAGEHAFGLFGALLAVPVFSIFQTLFVYFRRRAYPE